MWIVIELQTLANGTVANLVWSFDDQNAAESKYHSVLSAAAISELPVHAATLLNAYGREEKHEYYVHAVELEPQGEET